MVALLIASLAWGAATAWAVLQHASAAHDVVTSSEPLSLSAQRMYLSLSDADVTAATAFLASQNIGLPERERYAADIARAAADLSSLKSAPAANGPLRTALAAVSAGLPVYTGYVAQAQTERSLGYLLTGSSFMQVASEQMHLVLLPAAKTIYALQNAQLAASSAQATGLPLIAAAVLLAAGLGLILFRIQRWLTRRTHRVVNVGLFVASVVLVISVLWLAVAFLVARTDLQHGASHGSAPAELLAQAAIDTQRVRSDEVLNLISRSGSKPFVQDFSTVRGELGPGPGTLLTRAVSAAPAGQGARWAAAAARGEQAWYAVNDQVYNLDSHAQYLAETQLVIRTSKGSSGAGFGRVEADLSRAIAADQVIFTASATAGSNAFAGLAIGVVAAAVIMAAGCAGGLARRIAEYR